MAAPTATEAIAAILAKPAVTLTAASVAFGLAPSTGSRLVAAGTFPVPVIRAGARVIVPTPAIRAALQLEPADDPAASTGNSGFGPRSTNSPLPDPDRSGGASAPKPAA